MKKINKLILAPLSLTLLAITLAGCGEEEGIYGSSNNNEFTVSSFDSSYDNQTNNIAIARIDRKFSSGDYRIVPKNIIRNYTNPSFNNLNRTVLADKFEGTQENKNIEVNGRTVKRPIYENNNNNKLSYETDYVAYRLSGYSANDYINNTDSSKRRGIYTDLNKYSNIPNNIAFPPNSVCYVPVINSDIKFWSFNEKNKTGYRNLSSWIKDTENRFSSNKKPIRTSLSVGKNNNYDLEQIKFVAKNNEPEYLYIAVDYDKSIYDNIEYTSKGKSQPNTNEKLGVVDCTLVNNVAADFLEAKIKEYYR